MLRSLLKFAASLGLLLFGFPSNAMALTVYRTSCSCSVPWSTFPQKVQHFPAVFVGYVADVHYLDPPALWSYTFVVDRSWKGPAADTVNVAFRNRACEPNYQLGAKYLVLASSVGGRLIVPRCEDPNPDPLCQRQTGVPWASQMECEAERRSPVGFPDRTNGRTAPQCSDENYHGTVQATTKCPGRFTVGRPNGSFGPQGNRSI